ncbi:MAG TPA: hypothetical protein VLA05_03040 [Coriobacteriia bacterium]|nr:hypothetical protein [Coriobacteriia bacterium]
MPDMVNVPVPVDRLQEVYEVLARRPAGPAIVQESEDGYPHGWSAALIDRMFVESSSAMRRILRSVAQKSPGWITTGQIADASGLTARQVVASLGPFEKRVRGRYGMSEWPFAAREFVDEGILKYSMSPTVATRILGLAVEFETQDKESA